MLDHDVSFLVSSVVFGADTVCGQPIDQSVIHTRRCLFHNTHHNYNNMYIVIIFFRGYNIQDIVNTAMSPTTSFEAL